MTPPMSTPPMTPQTRTDLDAAVADRFGTAANSSRRVYLPLPYPSPPAALRGNSRGHWGKRHRAAAQVRRDVAYLARAAGLTSCAHLTVGLIWGPGDRRRRDEDNLAGLLKACADALSRGRADWTGLLLVPDDTPEHMHKLMPLIVAPPLRGLWLLVDPRHQSPQENTDA